MTHPFNAALEIEPPDIDRFKDSGSDTSFVHVLKSSVPGPTALVTSIIHGNEFSGAMVVADLLERGFQPARGTLILAFCNVQAFATFQEGDPGASRLLDEDLNRVWSADRLNGTGTQTRELTRAAELLPYVEAADYLIDLHSMSGDSPPMALTGISDKCVQFGKALGLGMALVSDRGHENGTRLRDFHKFLDPSNDAVSLLVECGQHWRARTAHVASAVAHRFLAYLEMGPAQAPLGPSAPHLQVTDIVAGKTKGFRFTENFQGLEVLPEAGTVIAIDGDREIRTPYDHCHLIMPTHGTPIGQTAVRLARELI